MGAGNLQGCRKISHLRPCIKHKLKNGTIIDLYNFINGQKRFPKRLLSFCLQAHPPKRCGNPLQRNCPTPGCFYLAGCLQRFQNDLPGCAFSTGTLLRNGDAPERVRP